MTPKTIFTLAFSLLSACMIAQKIKVKKDIVLIDKKETSLRVFEEKIDNNSFYNFTDANTGEVYFTADYVSDEISEGVKYEWLVLSKEGVTFENEVDMKFLSFTLNYKKAITEFLMKELNFFDVTGAVSEDALNDFFSEKRTRASQEEYDALVAEVREAEANYAKTASLGINVDSDLKRIFRGNIPYTSSSVDDRVRNADVIENMIGTYRFADANTLIIRDLDNYKIGTVTQATFGDVTITSQLFKTPITYNTKNNFSPTDKYATQKFVIEAVRHLHARGQKLGNSAKNDVAQANKEVRKEAQVSYEEAKANSSNIYGKKGYAIDDKGVRYEGEVTMIFENIPNPNDTSSGGNIVSLDGDQSGKKVTVAYLNKKDNKKYKTLSAKKGIRFCVFDENANEVWYEVIKQKSNGLLASSSEGVTLGTSNALFMKEIYKEGKATVYQTIPDEKYYLRVEGQEKAFNFEFGTLIKEEKKAAKLKEYLGGCEYKAGSYDEASFLDLDNIKDLIGTYNSCNN